MTRSTIEKATIGFGLVYLLVGILGFLPGITIPAAHHGPAPGAGLLLGIFAVNLIHNLAHLLVGAALVWGGLKAERAITVNRVMAGVFLFLVVASLIAPVVEGVAINPPDTILHLASALLTGYLGFGARWAAAVSRS